MNNGMKVMIRRASLPVTYAPSRPWPIHQAAVPSTVRPWCAAAAGRLTLATPRPKCALGCHDPGPTCEIRCRHGLTHTLTQSSLNGISGPELNMMG